jgi:DNA-binding MarR family transcriptional regulator
MTCLMNVNESICNNAAMKRASRCLGALYDEALAPSGLRATQYALLVQVARLGAPSMTDLARVLILDRSALSHTLRPLERDAIIALVPTPFDRRIKKVVLTEEGQRKMAAADVLWKKAQDAFEASFGADNAESLRTTLDGLTTLRFRLQRSIPRAA